MYTPLKNLPLKELLGKSIMFDANILMVGIENRNSDLNCSFDNMKELYIIPLLNSFSNIIIHEKVYNELDDRCKKLIDEYQNVSIVYEDDLYGKDPQYTTIFNSIADHERLQYSRSDSKNRGEVYSLAYAAFHKINCFSSKEIMVDEIAKEIKELKNIQIITFDIIVLLALIYHNNNNITSYNRALKSVYKKYCEDVIKRHKLPTTLFEYLKVCKEYL